MRNQIKELLQEYYELEEQQHSIVERLFNDNSQCEKWLEHIKSLEEDNKRLIEKINNLEEGLVSCKHDNNYLTDKINNYSAEIKKLRSKNEEQKVLIEELRVLPEADREFSVSSFLRREGVRLDEYYGVIGVLFADYSSIPVKEFIADHLMLFNSRSADYIDFLLPGYTNEDPHNNTVCIVDNVFLNGKQLYFDRDAFSKSVLNYRRIFGIDYLDRPVLILHELNSRRISPRRIILELDYKEVKELFNKIIDIAKQHTDISEFSVELQKKYLFCMFPKFLKLLISYFFVDIEEVDAAIEGVRRFRIKGK